MATGALNNEDRCVSITLIILKQCHKTVLISYSFIYFIFRTLFSCVRFTERGTHALNSTYDMQDLSLSTCMLNDFGKIAEDS